MMPVTFACLCSWCTWNGDQDVPITSVQGFFLSLKHAPYRRWFEIGEGTHMAVCRRSMRSTCFSPKTISRVLIAYLVRGQHDADIPLGHLLRRERLAAPRNDLRRNIQK